MPWFNEIIEPIRLPFLLDIFTPSYLKAGVD